MAQNVNAEIIAIGTEILLGEITDTNSVFIAQMFRDAGINVFYMTSVGDNQQRIADALKIAMSRAQIVITCGGLGPTVDDMTRQGVAQATERGLTFHQNLLDKIAERFAGFRVQMTENNKRQAYLPDDAIVIENPVGTAPSFIVEQGDRTVISLPGVPREMKFLLTESVLPYLRQRYDLQSAIIKAHILKTAGVGESQLDSLIGDDLLQASNPTVGLAAHSGQVDIRITAKADSTEEADRLIEATRAQVMERVGEFVFGSTGDTVEGALVNVLRERSGQLAISTTGIENVVAERLRSVVDSESVVMLARTHDDPDKLRNALQLDAAISLRQLAEHEARQLCKETGVMLGIAVVCYPHREQDQADVDEGSAIAVCVGDEVRSRVYGFGGQNDTARLWTGNWSLSMGWRMLKDNLKHED